MATKGLLIRSYVDKTGSRGVWNELDDTYSYIQGIRTSQIGDGNMQAEIFASLISGLPSPWARVKLFEFALSSLSSPDPNIDRAGLLQVYEGIHAEWRGLIALIALYSDRISFSSPVYMDYRGQAYDIAASMGRMLFDERDVWSNQDDLDRNKAARPFLHLIYYNKELIGGTSPKTGVFTGVSYKLGDEGRDIAWYRDGKLEDPTKLLTPDQLNKVYLFVLNLRGNMQAYEAKINSCRGAKPLVDIKGFKSALERWQSDLERVSRGDLRSRGPIASYDELLPPYADLLHSDVPVYLKPDYTFTYIRPDGNCQVIDNVQSLLGDHKAVLGWVDDSNPRYSLRNAPVYYLRVEDPQMGTSYYFTVPLSERALVYFRNSMASLLGYGIDGKASVTGRLTDAGKLAVSMTIEIDGAPVTLNTREYPIDWVNAKRVILWPNFQSERWTKYYFYTEFTGKEEQRFFPIYQTSEGYITQEFGDQLYVCTPGAEQHPDIRAEYLVRYPDNVQEDKPIYDIMSSTRPVGALYARTKHGGQDVSAGYLVVRNGSDGLEDLGQNPAQMDVTVGIDFGSNNTCMYYAANNDGAQALPIHFENNRLVVVGLENHDPKAMADINELLFMTNSSASNGQFKSWLHEHEATYNSHNEAKEIAGGVPVNRHNIRVQSMDQFNIVTQAGILHYNMKWLDDDKGLMKKKAFLKGVWLQACAYLFRSRIAPKIIHWSYPGSMMKADRTNLELAFDELCKITPIANCGVQIRQEGDPITEAEAVCSYALTQQFGLTDRNLILGIDVGGSTSDILLLARDPHRDNKISLLRESSVRVASGVFTDAVKRSAKFREAIYSFHEANKQIVSVADIKDILTNPDKSPFFLMGVFDQLQGDGFEAFYTSISDKAKSVYALPAYITGLLMYYSGILIGHTIKVRNLNQIEEVNVLAFGKGGRVFHWLCTMPGRRLASEYYRRCLNAGLSLVLPDRELRVNYRDSDDIRRDSKAEVAKGLCVLRDLAIDSSRESEICGESGLRYRDQDGSPIELTTDSELYASYFRELSRFSINSTPNFEAFMDIYFDFVDFETGICKGARSKLQTDLQDLPSRIENVIANDPEYKKAQRNAANGEFHYRQPMFIAEGLSFMQTIVEKLLD